MVIEYLKNPPSRERLKELIAAMGIPVRALLREKGTPYAELGLGDPKWTDDELIDFMMAHPDPHQPADRRHAEGGEALPAVGKGARRPAKSGYRPLRQGRWRGRQDWPGFPVSA